MEMVIKEEKEGALLVYPIWCQDGGSIVYEWLDKENCEIRRLDLSTANEACIFKSQGEIRELRLSPDGRWVSFVFRKDGESSLHMLAIDGGKPVLLANDVSGRDYSHSWGPDAKTVAVIRHDTNGGGRRQYLGLIGIGDKKTSRLDACGRRVLSVEWSPNSELIAYCARSETGVNRVWTVYSDGTLATPCSSGSIDLLPAWSPDGRFLAYVKTRRVGGAKAENRIFVMTRTGTQERELQVGSGSASFPKWSPDGHEIACIVSTSSPDGKVSKKVLVVEFASDEFRRDQGSSAEAK